MPKLLPSYSRMEEPVVVGVKVASNVLTSNTETDTPMQQLLRSRKPFEYFNHSNHRGAASQVSINHPVYWGQPGTMQKSRLYCYS